MAYDRQDALMGESSPAAADGGGPAAAEGQPTIALVVDDETTTRILARSVLENMGYQVFEAEDGEQALACFQRTQPQLVVMDVLMPRMDGFACCTALRALPAGADVPVVLITGIDDSNSIEQAYRAGATDFVHKPINWILFRHRINFVARASQAFLDLKRSQARLLQAQKLAKLGYWEWNLRRNTVEMSYDLTALLGLPPQPGTLSETQLWDCVPEPVRERLARELREAIREQRSYSLDFRVPALGGERIVHAEGEIIANAEGLAVLMRGIMQDVTEQVRAQEEINRLAHYDPLTGLPNRTLFIEQLRLALSRAKRQRSAIGVLSVGLRRIEQMREAMGTVFADLAIHELAQRLQDSLPNPDQTDHSHIEVARFGTHEFVLFADHPDSSIGELPRLAQRIIDRLAAPFHIGTQPVQVGCSIGIACAPDDGKDPETLLKHAHAAMNVARRKGELVYEYHTREIQRSVMERFQLEGQLLVALRERQLEVHFQPQMALANRAIVGFEALARWRHPVLGMIPPDRFIPIAEDSGAIGQLGEHVLRNALEQHRQWPVTKLGQPALLSVNLSARQLWGKDFMTVIHRVLDQTGFDPATLVLELTESVLMKDSDDMIRILKRLKDMGIKLSIDDFGTGFSSMSYFKHLPIDELKIDRGFIRDLPRRGQDLAIVRSVIALAHNLGLKIVAEGVETAEQLRILEQEGCDWVQGFLIGRPADSPAAIRFLGQAIPSAPTP
ncbi:MAG: EAL domain-containing protein [Methylococcaceae bacterium]|nr:EAL domain-containing protein [Methylococcaceae bacterium]